MDGQTLIGLGSEAQKLVIFEFDAVASVQAYFPGYAGFVLGAWVTTVNVAIAVGSISKFPVALPNGATKRVLDNLVLSMGVSGANLWFPTRIPFSAGESIYCKTYSAASGVVSVTISRPV